MRKIMVVIGIFSSLLLVSCNSDIEDNTEEVKVEEFEPYSILFKESTFSDTASYRLLKELNICSDIAVNDAGELIAPCAASNFTFIPFSAGKSIQNGFILVVRADTGGFPLRRVLIFERENGNLVKVNGFIGNLIGKRKSDSGYDDILMRFIDKIDGSNVFYNCIFKWENGKYQFKSVEYIEEPAGAFKGRVLESVKDSVSNDIYQSLLGNQMIF